MPEKTPNQFHVRHFANTGTSEEFMQQMLEMVDLLNAGTIFEPERQEVKGAIMIILLEGLLPASEHLKKIRASITEQMPDLNRKQQYEDFTRVLWHGYKDLMPKAVTLIGAQIGFLFQNDTNFEKGLIEFGKTHPSVPTEFGDFLRAQRTNWQNELADFRNHYLEHRQEEPEKHRLFYQPEHTEALFDAVWRTTVDILTMFLAMNFLPGVGLEEIPVAERTGPLPRRFRFVILGPPQSPDQIP